VDGTIEHERAFSRQLKSDEIAKKIYTKVASVYLAENSLRLSTFG
jgi:hypothetical protein